MGSVGLNMIAAAMIWGVLVYYLIVAWLLRLPAQQGTVMTLYEPPAGISPALAAYFLHPGDPVISLATCLVDLTQRGFIRLKSVPVDGYYIEPADDSAKMRWWEHQTIEQLSECTLSPKTVRNASGFLNSLLERELAPRYVSPHNFLFFLPAIIPVLLLLQILSAMFDRNERIALLLIAGVIYWAFVSLGPFGTTSRWVGSIGGPPDNTGKQTPPLQASIVKSAWVTMLAVASFCLFGAFTRTWLPLAAAFSVASIFGRIALRAPTKEGWELSASLEGFKRFLSSVEADPINVLNAPAEMPKKIHQHLAFALAFDVEHSWAERLLYFLRKQLGSGLGEEITQEVERSLENKGSSDL